MFTATRMAAVTAVLALTGSLALMAGPLAPAEPVPPSAAEAPGDPVEPTHFTGKITAWQIGDGEKEWLADRMIERLRVKLTAETTDARISGQGEAMNYHEYVMDPEGGGVGMSTSVGRLTNDQGSYTTECQGAGPHDVGSPGFCWLSGEGAYEGLTAFIVLTAGDSSTSQVEGWLYEGQRPPLLEFEP